MYMETDMNFGAPAPMVAAPVEKPKEEKKTRVDPNRDDQIAAAKRRRAEIMKRRGRSQLRTDETIGQVVARGFKQTRGGTNVG